MAVYERRPVPSCPGYSADTNGDIFGPRGLRKPVVGAKGYLVCNVYIEGRIVQKKYHFMVCEAFHGPKPVDAECIRHRNGKQANCRPDNLAWGTHQENTNDRASHGTLLCGECANGAKLTNEQARAIRRAYSPSGRHDLANRYSVSLRTIERIVAGRTFVNA